MGSELIKENIRFEELLKEKIPEIAREAGLDPFPIQFDEVPASIMYELGAYGLPGRFSHWTSGAAYYRMKTMYDYGLSKIYELAINANPVYAFLLEGNNRVQNILVAAHVVGHSDFFKNNAGYRETNRQMVEIAALHSERIRAYEFIHGKITVEKFLDNALSLVEGINIDPESPCTFSKEEYLAENRRAFEEKQKSRQRAATSYDDIFELGEPKTSPEKQKVLFPAKAEQNLISFIAMHSQNLEDWQRDILRMLEEELRYFLPQIRTKIMNEGWACLSHLKIGGILCERNLLSPAESIEYAALHAAVVTPSRLGINPYFVGLEIWKNVERLGNVLPHPQGKKEKNWRGETIDPEFYNCQKNEAYDIRWVMKNTASDSEFIRSYLTNNLIDDMGFYLYTQEGNELRVKEKNPVIIRSTLLNSMVNCGTPVIKIAEGGADYKQNGEFYLKHHHEGIDLDLNYAEKTLGAIYHLWGKTVHLETVIDNQRKLITCLNGDTFQQKSLESI